MHTKRTMDREGRRRQSPLLLLLLQQGVRGRGRLHRLGGPKRESSADSHVETSLRWGQGVEPQVAQTEAILDSRILRSTSAFASDSNCSSCAGVTLPVATADEMRPLTTDS